MRGKKKSNEGVEVPKEVKIRYRYKDSKNGILILHNHPPAELEFKTSYRVDIRNIVSLFLRESLFISGLKQEDENVKKLLDFVIGCIFRGVTTFGGSTELTDSHLEGIQENLNDTKSRNIATLRRALNQAFKIFYLEEAPKTEIVERNENEKKPLLTPLDLEGMIVDELKERRKKDPRNRIYDLVIDPGIKVEIKEGKKNKLVTVMDLISSYVQIARIATKEPGYNIEPEFNYAQVKSAISGIIGLVELEKNVRRDMPLIAKRLANNVENSLDPVMFAARKSS